MHQIRRGRGCAEPPVVVLRIWTTRGPPDLRSKFDARPSPPPFFLHDALNSCAEAFAVSPLHVMIVLHPSSRCDVCLDPYTWNTTSDAPHAIPCGHIFCKTWVLFPLLVAYSLVIQGSTSTSRCLRTLAPSLCPLCRKTFLPERAKRLHVDRPPETTGTDLELDFLQRLALVSEHAPPENVEEAMTEVQTWLDAQPSGSVSIV